MNPIDQIADERDKLKAKLRQAKAKLREANQRIARLENAGDALARQTIANGRSHLQWFASKEAKP
jgi:uncharacterized coiled-coil DUF342 family protein